MSNNDLILSGSENTRKRNLTARFISTGVISIVIIAVGMTLRGYYVLRLSGVENEAQRVGVKVSEVVDMARISTEKNQRRHIARVGESLKHMSAIESAIIYSAELNAIWPKASATKLNPDDSAAARQFLANTTSNHHVLDLNASSLTAWVAGPTDNASMLPVLIKLREPSGKVFAIARVNYNFDEALEFAQHFGFRLLVFSFLCSLVLFLSLYYTFRRGIQTIEQQEEKLNHQIARLSSLLSDNKELQKTMKTASARAVELNEQFLRRVGADLHDGPAQMIGFAVLRLNQVSKHEAAKSFGHEFHAVREALDESLDEIRGISSGLVLPELETLSLEQCLRKVVTLHSAKSKTTVDQYYQELPNDIELPIKICAYRFIQEGLNNSHRHSGAKKCRLSAYVKGDELVISLKDNGVGFRKSKLKQKSVHLGLVGLKDRVESLGGKFSINSELGSGTALKVTISLADDG